MNIITRQRLHPAYSLYGHRKQPAAHHRMSFLFLLQQMKTTQICHLVLRAKIWLLVERHSLPQEAVGEVCLAFSDS